LKTITADFARVIDRQPEQDQFIVLLGTDSNRPDLGELQEEESVILDEGDLHAEGVVFSEMHAKRRFWYARVRVATVQAE
jgi:hypothetical protein